MGRTIGAIAIIESRVGSVLDQEVMRSSQIVNIFLKIEPTESAEKNWRCEKQRSSFKDDSSFEPETYWPGP